MINWKTISVAAVLEGIAIIGALPIWISRFSGSYYNPLWTKNLAFVGFLLIAAGVTLFYTRHETLTIKICATFFIVGLLLFTAVTIMALI